MKKLMLACTAALFSLAVYAQEGQQDSTRTETNQYRQNREQQTKENMDSTSIRQDAEEMKNEGERELDTLQQDASQMRDSLAEEGNNAGNQIRTEAREMRDSARQDMNQAGDSLRQDAQQTENQIRQGAENTKQDLREGAENTKQNLRQGANRVGNEVKEGANSVKENVNEAGQSVQSSNSPAMNQNSAQDQSSSTMNEQNSGENGNAMASELEVVEGKEGPNNELVYKFKGEMWYVDRESKQMVKADESKLKDSKHEVMIHEGSNSANAKTNNNRKKGKS